MDRLLTTAAGRRWLMTRDQLRELGLEDVAIRHRVRTDRLHRVHDGVYVVGRPELSREATWLAATLAVERSSLSHFSAAALWGLVPARGGLVHVTAPTQAGLSQRTGVRVHRCTSLRAERTTRREGIPVTTLARTLRDLAWHLQARDLDRVIRQAEVLHRLDLRGLAADLRLSPPNAARERRLLKAVERYVPGEVDVGFEEAMLELIVRGNLPLPMTQHQIGEHRVDFAWPDLMLVVETDDRWSHDTTTGFRNDRVRDRQLQALGFTVLRFTYAEVTRERGAVTRELRAAIRRLQKSSR